MNSTANYYTFKGNEGRRSGSSARGSYKKSSYKKTEKKGSGITDEAMAKKGYRVIACYYNILGKQVRCWESANDTGLVIRLKVKKDVYTIHYENRQDAISRLQKIMKPGFKNGGYVRDRKTERELCAEQSWS